MTDIDPNAPAPDPTPAPPDPAQDPAKDWKAEYDKVQAEARKWEDRAKANKAAAAELEKLRTASMTELERTVAETKAATRAEVLREVGSTRVDDLMRVAAAGRPIEIDAVLDGLDRSRFLDDDGQPDPKAIRAYVDRLAPAPAEPGVPRVPTGPRGTTTTNADPAQDFGNTMRHLLKF